MICSRALLLLLSTCSTFPELFSAETEVPPSWVVTIPSGSALVIAWQEGLYARLWRDPALNDLRERSANWLKEIEQLSGLDPVTLLSNAGQLTAQVNDLERDPDGFVQAKAVIALNLGPETAHVHETMGKRLPNVPTALWGDVLLLRFNSDAAVVTSTKPDGDPVPVVHAAFDQDRVFSTLLAVAPKPLQAGLTTIRESFSYYAGTVEYDLQLLPNTIHEQLRLPRPPQGPLPLDRALLARLPDNTLMMFAQGINGSELWRDERENLLRDLQEDFDTTDIDETEAAVDEALKELGAHHGIAELFSGLNGTLVGVMTQGAPLPGFGVIVPRSAALDDLIQAAAAALELTLPDEGAISAISIPGIPVVAQLARDRGFWLLTTDQGLALTWAEGKPGGWADSPAGSLALAKAKPESFLIASSDSPAVLRLLTGWIATRVKNMNLDPVSRRSLVKGLAAAAALSNTGYLFGYGEKRGEVETTVLETQGVLGFGAYGALIISLAIKPSANPRADNETAAVAVLRDQIWPNEETFQSEGHLDQDGDGTGEYGLLPELAGTPMVNGSTTTLLSARFTDPAIVLRGYHFALHLPDGKGGAVTAESMPRTARLSFGAARAQAKQYVVYAWPDRPEHGHRIFSMNQNGDVFVAPFTGEAPTWNALFGGADKGWDDEVVWAEFDE